jgi:hypothetical protein
MKNLIITLAAVLIASGGILAAQSSYDTVKFHLDQPALVGDVELPAGNCTVNIVNSATGNNALLFRCGSGVQVIALANPLIDTAGRKAGVVLIFGDNGNRIDQVWLASTGYKII